MDYLSKISAIFRTVEDKSKYLGKFEELVTDDVKQYIVDNNKYFEFYKEVIIKALADAGEDRESFEALFFQYVNDRNWEGSVKARTDRDYL